jgi:hypothetical protein
MKATSFADLSDLLEYNKRVRNGMSPEGALSFGDNGLGSTNLSTVAGTGPAVALPHPWISRKVRVTIGDKTVEAEVRDTAPHGVVDLNPDACTLLGLVPPVLVEDGVVVEWLTE